jgi:RIO-like serine/threonine protein kinase
MNYTLVPLSSSKPIFGVKEDSRLFGKGGVSKEEEMLQRRAADLGVAPSIHFIVSHNGMNVVLMRRINGMSLADFYGEEVESIPAEVWSQVHDILQILWNNGIEYSDITPYNFMIELSTEKVWVVDFGHARNVQMNPCLRTILQGGTIQWNAEYQ